MIANEILDSPDVIGKLRLRKRHRGAHQPGNALAQRAVETEFKSHRHPEARSLDPLSS
jgi:hypothetical protein